MSLASDLFLLFFPALRFFQRDGDPYINSFTFSTFKDLMVFSQSTNRKNLLWCASFFDLSFCETLPLTLSVLWLVYFISCLSKLNHMLEATSDYQVAAERSFSDAFTELCVPTGAKAQVSAD